MPKSLVDGIGDGRVSYSEYQDGNGLPLVPQLLLKANARRLFASITNESDVSYNIDFGTPNVAEGMVGTDYVGGIEIYPHETLFLEIDLIRSLCEWTGEVYSQGRGVGDYFRVNEVSNAP